MRKSIFCILGAIGCLATIAFAYLAWPMAAALEIREAMRAGDVETLNRTVDWDSVRASLKASMTPEAMAKLAQNPEAPKRSLWQSFKATVAPRFADTVIDRYVTPEQLPVFLGYRETYRENVRPALGLKDPPGPLAGTPLAETRLDKGLAFWKRVRRAVFTSPSRLILEVEDQRVTSRSFTGVLERRGWQWQLTGLSIAGI